MDRTDPWPLPDDIREQSRIILHSRNWLVGIPQTPNAMFWWGAFTEWCVAADQGLFNDYNERGPLIVFRSRDTSFRWALHPTTKEFRNAGNRRVSWSGFLMRNPEVAASLLLALPNIRLREMPPMQPLVLGLSALVELVRHSAHDNPIAAMHLEEMEGAAMRALDYCK